jgi:hypothetical protein
MEILINNDHPNMKLVYLVHFIKDATCHIRFPQQINPKSIMKANFITELAKVTFGGALLYHLQRKEDTAKKALNF